MIDFIANLAKKHTDALGFIPRPTLEKYIDNGQVLIARENGEPCGFLVYGAGWPRLRIYQACIQYDAQRQAHGLALVGRLIAFASARGYDAISLWCADDLPANMFWLAAGFQRLRSKPGGRRRGRQLNLWVYWLPTLIERPTDRIAGAMETAVRRVVAPASTASSPSGLPVTSIWMCGTTRKKDAQPMRP